MKSVFLIAIVAVTMIGMTYPMTVFGQSSMTETLPTIVVDKTMYYPGEIIKISGNIENVIRGVSVDIVLTNPDGSTEEFRTPCKSNGDYSITLQVNSEYTLGEYVITSYYNSEFVGKETFSIMTKSQIDNETSTIEQIPGSVEYYFENNLVYEMKSGWMEPTIKMGEVVITEKIPFENIKIGDIIVYQQPAYLDNVSISRVLAILENNPKVIRASSGDTYPDKWIAGVTSPITEMEYVGIVIGVVPPEEFEKFLNENNDTSPKIPAWIKNNAEWWANGTIDDSTFLSGIEYLVNAEIIKVDATSKQSETLKEIPAWVKNNSEWWANGTIDDSTFLSGIEFLVKEGIIVVR
jgi:TusA-related sulfurtransferase